MRRPASLLPLALLPLVAACTPHQAEVKGAYTTWLAHRSSATVAEGKFDLSKANSIIDCTEPPLKDSDVDCATVAPEYFLWLAEDTYYVFKGDLEPWRSEAIITSEGDFQLTFHVGLEGGEDFRVALVIDPDFAPKKCEQDPTTGEVALQPVDGADWVEQWSADEDGMFIYYLNAGAYQYNPSDSRDYWILPDEWAAGFSASKFVAEEFYSEAPIYGDYNTAVINWYSNNPATWQGLVDQATTRQTTWAQELIEQGLAQSDFAIKMESNDWRPVDNTQAGLDGWVEMDFSWVRLDKRPLAVGDSVKGDFQVLMYSSESSSRTLLTGSFEVPEIMEDKAGYPNLDEQKREENDTPVCE
jgi:hypothetical protein